MKPLQQEQRCTFPVQRGPLQRFCRRGRIGDSLYCRVHGQLAAQLQAPAAPRPSEAEYRRRMLEIGRLVRAALDARGIDLLALTAQQALAQHKKSRKADNTQGTLTMATKPKRTRIELHRDWKQDWFMTCTAPDGTQTTAPLVMHWSTPKKLAVQIVKKKHQDAIVKLRAPAPAATASV